MSAYVDWGYGENGDRKITTEGELLASLPLADEEIRTDKLADSEDALGVFNKFVEAGGDDGHSGFSWSCVREVAYRLREYGWKTIDEMPRDHMLADRVVFDDTPPVPEQGAAGHGL